MLHAVLMEDIYCLSCIALLTVPTCQLACQIASSSSVPFIQVNCLLQMTDSNSADTDISDEGSSSAIGDSQDNYGLIFNDLGLELQPELPRYQEEPLLQKEQQQLRQDLEVPIKCHGREQLLQQHLNLDLLGPQGLAR